MPRHYKVTVQTLGDSWRSYARMVPEGIEPLGTVTRDKTTHAFGRDSAGDYWIFGDGRPEKLPRDKVQRGVAAVSMRERGKTDDSGLESENG